MAHNHLHLGQNLHSAPLQLQVADSLVAARRLQVVQALVHLEVKIKRPQGLAHHRHRQADCLDNRIRTRSEHRVLPAYLEEQEAVLGDLEQAHLAEAPLARQRPQGSEQTLSPRIKGRQVLPFRPTRRRIPLPTKMCITRASHSSSLIRISHLKS